MFGLFSGERVSSTYSTSRDEASDAAAGTCPHRHRWALPNFSWRVAVRRDVRRKRFASTAAVRRARKERGRHSFCRETSWQTRGSHACSALTTAPSTRTVCSWTSATASEFVASLRHRTHHSRMDPSRARYRELSRLDTDLEFHRCTHRVLEQYVRGLLQRPRNSSQVYGTVHTTAEWTRRERDIASFQGWARGATWSSTAVPGHPPGRDPGLYRRGRNEPLAGVATLGIGMLQQGGNVSERRVAFPP